MLGMGKINPVMQWPARPWAPGFAEIAATHLWSWNSGSGHWAYCNLLLQSQQEIYAVRLSSVSYSSRVPGYHRLARGLFNILFKDSLNYGLCQLSNGA